MMKWFVLEFYHPALFVCPSMNPCTIEIMNLMKGFEEAERETKEFKFGQDMRGAERKCWSRNLN